MWLDGNSGLARLRGPGVLAAVALTACLLVGCGPDVRTPGTGAAGKRLEAKDNSVNAVPESVFKHKGDTGTGGGMGTGGGGGRGRGGGKQEHRNPDKSKERGPTLPLSDKPGHP